MPDEQHQQIGAEDRAQHIRIECPLCASSRSRSRSTRRARGSPRPAGATRWPGAAPGEPWAQGTDLAYLRDLCAYWAEGFDWRARERGSTRYAQFLAEVDGVRVHFVHVRRGGTPLILSHGWPSAFLEYLPLVTAARRLRSRDPVAARLRLQRPARAAHHARHGEALAHADAAGWATSATGAGGTDWGAAVTTYMALDEPEPLIGIHLANLDTCARRRSRRRRPSASTSPPARAGTRANAATASSRARGRRRSPTA